MAKKATYKLFNGSAFEDIYFKTSVEQVEGLQDALSNIGAAQVQSDWNATSGMGVIKNKPTIPTNNNQLTNGAGYITGYTETDPIFTAWNKSTGISITKSQVSDLLEATQALSGLMSATDKTRLDVLHSLLEEDTANNVVDSINEVLAIFNNYPEGADLVTALAGKVDKVSGKGLSTNDYTTTEKNKLAGIATGATNLTIGTTSTTAKAGNYHPTWAQVTGKPGSMSGSVIASAEDNVAGSTTRFTTPWGLKQGIMHVADAQGYLKSVSYNDITGSKPPVNATANTGTVTNVSAGTQVSGLTLSVTNGTTTPTITTSISNAANFRSAIGAGTGSSNLTIGTTSTTAKAGNYHPTWAQVTGKPGSMSGSVIASAENNTAGNTIRFTTPWDLKEGIMNLTRPANWTPTWGDVTGKPTFATVATSGSYADLTNKPTIPSIPILLGTTEGNNGTATNQRTINAVNLKSIILHHSPAGSRPASDVSAWAKKPSLAIGDIPTGTTGTTVALGNHTHSQYLTSFTETDPTVPSHVKSITSANITSWNSKQNALGFTPENAANKRTSIRVSGANDTSYVSELGVKTYVDGLIGSVYRPAGDWNANLNLPTLANNTPANAGKVYRVSVRGHKFGFTFDVGDKLAFNESGVISKWDNVDDVVSVNGQTGTVVLTTDNISQGSNLYVSASEKSTWNDKQNAITGAASTIASNNLTTHRALTSNGSGKVAVSTVTSVELGFLDGVTSSVQTQLDSKMPSSWTPTWNQVSGKPSFAPVNAQKNSDITKAEIEAKLTGNITSHTHSQYVLTTGKAADSNKLNGLELNGTTTNNQANKVMRTDASGYANFGWINTISGNTDSAVTDVYVNTNDGYIRKKTLAKFKAELGTMPSTWASVSGKPTWIGSSKPTYSKSDVGLGNVENKSSATIRSEITASNIETALKSLPNINL